MENLLDSLIALIEAKAQRDLSCAYLQDKYWLDGPSQIFDTKVEETKQRFGKLLNAYIESKILCN